MDTDRSPKPKEKSNKRRNSKLPINQFLVTSEEQPKKLDKSDENGGYDAIRRQLSRM